MEEILHQTNGTMAQSFGQLEKGFFRTYNTFPTNLKGIQILKS